MEETEIANNLKFAMTVAVAGRHNMLVVGSVGLKENKVLYKLPQILPKLSPTETQSTTRIHSIAGLLKPNQDYMTVRPFRVPHQTATIEGMCGGGIHCNPGEISLAHNGVLFLDEASEFRTSVLQMLRVPITTRSITLSRAGRSTVYPADFQLVMSTQPCPCGNYGRKDKICLCSAKSMEMYWRKFSAPLLDRVEIRFNVNSDETLTNERMTLAKMSALITNAWTMQEKRGGYNGKKDFIYSDEFPEWFENKEDFQTVRKIESVNSLNRKRFQTLMLARTLADMRFSEKISHSDLELAMKLRADTFIEEIG